MSATRRAFLGAAPALAAIAASPALAAQTLQDAETRVEGILRRLLDHRANLAADVEIISDEALTAHLEWSDEVEAGLVAEACGGEICSLRDLRALIRIGEVIFEGYVCSTAHDPEIRWILQILRTAAREFRV